MTAGGCPTREQNKWGRHERDWSRTERWHGAIPGAFGDDTFSVAATSLHHCTGARRRRRRLYQRLAPASHWLLGISRARHRRRLRHQQMAGARRQRGPVATDLDSGAALGCRPCRDGHHADVRRSAIVADAETSLVLLTLLALGAFLAGVSLIAFLDLAMGITVPAISWLQQSIIFFLLGAVLLIGLGITFWLRRERSPASSPVNTGSQTEA